MNLSCRYKFTFRADRIVDGDQHSSAAGAQRHRLGTQRRKPAAKAAPQPLHKVFSAAKIISAINWTRLSSLINNFVNKQMLIIFTGGFFFLFPKFVVSRMNQGERCIKQMMPGADNSELSAA